MPWKRQPRSCAAIHRGRRRSSMALEFWASRRLIVRLRRCACRYAPRRLARMKCRANFAAASRSSFNGKEFRFRLSSDSRWLALLPLLPRQRHSSQSIKLEQGEIAMSQITYEEVNLMLKLYEMRREPRLRQARAWFLEHFHPLSPEDMMQKFPQGGEENTFIRMVISYWD